MAEYCRPSVPPSLSRFVRMTWTEWKHKFVSWARVYIHDTSEVLLLGSLEQLDLLENIYFQCS